MEEYINDPVFFCQFGFDILYYLLEHKPEKSELIKNIIIKTKGKFLNKKSDSNILLSIINSGLSDKIDVLNTLIKLNPATINRKGTRIYKIKYDFIKYLIMNKYKCTNGFDIDNVIFKCNDANLINLLLLFNQVAKSNKVNHINIHSSILEPNLVYNIPKSTLKNLIILFLKKKIKSGQYYSNETVNKPINKSKKMIHRHIYFPDNFPFILAVRNN